DGHRAPNRTVRARHRSLRRDRVRSVDTAAKLRHRLAGFRVVTVGAGQQTGAGESALVLDALSKTDAVALRERLIEAGPAPAIDSTGDEAIESIDEGAVAEVQGGTAVFATFRPWWVVYNMFSIWAYLMAAGLLWGAF